MTDTASLIEELGVRVERVEHALEVITEAADFTDDPWPEADWQEMSVALRVKAMRALLDQYRAAAETARRGYRNLAFDHAQLVDRHTRLRLVIEKVVVGLEPVARDHDGASRHLAKAVIDALKTAHDAVTPAEAAKPWPPTAADEGDVWADARDREWTVAIDDGDVLMRRAETETPDPADYEAGEPDWVQATYGPLTFLRGAGRDVTTDESLGGS